MKRRPYLQLYVQDVLGDQQLNKCGPGAHGLMLRLMCIAHVADPYGYIVDGDTPLTEQDMCDLRAWNRQTVGKAWAELVLHRRIKQADSGVWYVPRMVKDEAYRLKQSAFGKTGGNPHLKPPLKPPPNPESYTKTHTEGESKGEGGPGPIDYEKYPHLKTIHSEPKLRFIKLEEWMQMRRNRSKYLDWTKAVKRVMDRATLATIKDAAPWVDAQLSYYETDHRDSIARRENHAKERAREVKAVAAVLSENGNDAALSVRLLGDLKRMFGPGAVKAAKALAASGDGEAGNSKAEGK